MPFTDQSIKLGSRVRDTLSELEGIVIARTEWLYGCVRLSVQPNGNKDGKPFEAFAIDEPQAVLVEDSIKEKAAAKHGGRDNIQPRKDAF